MKLIVTVGNANGETEELVFDVPGTITWMDAEVETSNGRSRILRIPFFSHEMGLHTICTRNGEIEEMRVQ